MTPAVDTTTQRPGALRAVFDRIATVTLIVAAAGIIGMACIEGWQVFARYVLNQSPSWTEPVALLFMTTTMMFGAALGVRAERHFGFFILLEAVGPALRRVLSRVAQLIAVLLGAMLAGWGGEMMIDAWDYSMPGAPMPQGLTYMPLCVGGALIALFAVEKIIAPAPPRAPSAE